MAEPTHSISFKVRKDIKNNTARMHVEQKKAYKLRGLVLISNIVLSCWQAALDCELLSVISSLPLRGTKSIATELDGFLTDLLQ